MGYNCFALFPPQLLLRIPKWEMADERRYESSTRESFDPPLYTSPHDADASHSHGERRFGAGRRRETQQQRVYDSSSRSGSYQHHTTREFERVAATRYVSWSSLAVHAEEWY